MNDMSVFIGGLDRSGKTYMRFMLESHPDFVLSKRTNLWTRYYQQFGSLEQVENFQLCVDALKKNKHIMALEPDFELVKSEFQQTDQDYPDLFEIIHRQRADRVGKKYWGDQTEFLEITAPVILDAYSHAKFIHLIRDPRDRYEAVLTKYGAHKSLGIETARWLYSASLANKNQKIYPDQYLIIRYEKMVDQPEETMMEVCDFLDVRYYPAMIRMEGIPRFEGITREGKKASPLTPQFIGRFQKFLDPSQVTFIQMFSARFMKDFGYPLVSAKIPWKDQFIKKVSDLSLNLLYLFGWRVLNTVGRGR